MAENAAGLPARIKRYCCSPHKSCGNTTLILIENEFLAGWPPLYAYVRESNGDFYTNWLVDVEMKAWLEETKDDVHEEEDRG